jgi:hypothetical protein
MRPAGKLSSERAAEVLQQWAKLGAEIATPRRNLRSDGAAVKRMIGAAHETLLPEGEHLRTLLKESNVRLQPLADPLMVDFGAHEWLSNEPETA